MCIRDRFITKTTKNYKEIKIYDIKSIAYNLPSRGNVQANL